MNSNITINITKDGVEGTTPTQQTTKKASAKESVSNQAVRTAVINASKQILNSAVSQFGNMTGNYVMQKEMQSLISISADVMAIAIGGTVGAIAVGTKYAITAATSFIDTTKANNQISMLQRRSGGIISNGGRGTND